MTMMKSDKKHVYFIIFSRRRQEQGRSVNGKMLASAVPSVPVRRAAVLPIPTLCTLASDP